MTNTTLHNTIHYQLIWMRTPSLPGKKRKKANLQDLHRCHVYIHTGWAPFKFLKYDQVQVKWEPVFLYKKDLFVSTEACTHKSVTATEVKIFSQILNWWESEKNIYCQVFWLNLVLSAQVPLLSVTEMSHLLQSNTPSFSQCWQALTPTKPTEDID